MKLKEKQKGINFDINVKDMDCYKKFADNYNKHNQRLKLANDKANKMYTSSNSVKEISITDKLRPKISVFSSAYINTSFNKKKYLKNWISN